jgi:hypothetical protein
MAATNVHVLQMAPELCQARRGRWDRCAVVTAARQQGIELSRA